MNDKGERILKAALKEFASHGYLSASTNRITESAGVSKGMLFHLFGSKKALYLKLVNMIISELNDAFQYDELIKLDFFSLLRESGKIKARFYATHMDEYKVALETFYHTPKDVKEEITELYQSIYTKNYALIIDKFNEKKLRDGVDRKKAFDLVFSTFGFLEKKYLSMVLKNPDYEAKVMDAINEDFDEYLDMLINGIL